MVSGVTPTMVTRLARVGQPISLAYNVQQLALSPVGAKSKTAINLCVISYLPYD